MLIVVYRRLDGREIIISTDTIYHYDSETEIETFEEVKFKNFERLGSISLDVWRWQCADTSMLEKYGESIDSDSVVVDVELGSWKIEHYFDYLQSGHIYSKLFLLD